MNGYMVVWKSKLALVGGRWIVLRISLIGEWMERWQFLAVGGAGKFRLNLILGRW